MVRFALLTFLAQKRRILGRKNGLALRDREREKCSNGKRYGTLRYGTVLRINSDPLLYRLLSFKRTIALLLIAVETIESIMTLSTDTRFISKSTLPN
jgi:hypothetical protein